MGYKSRVAPVNSHLHQVGRGHSRHAPHSPVLPWLRIEPLRSAHQCRQGKPFATCCHSSDATLPLLIATTCHQIQATPCAPSAISLIARHPPLATGKVHRWEAPLPSFLVTSFLMVGHHLLGDDLLLDSCLHHPAALFQ